MMTTGEVELKLEKLCKNVLNNILIWLTLVNQLQPSHINSTCYLSDISK